MNTHKLLIIIILFLNFSILNASDTLKLIPYEPTLEQKINYKNVIKKEDLNLGMALQLKTNKKSNFDYILAYDGDYMIFNHYLKEDNQIKQTNYYLKIKYNF
jgi:hypothetical protein